MSKSTRAPQVPKELTRKHLARAERDARATRYLVLGVGAAVALAVLAIVFGVLRESVFLPNEPVARVGDQTILTREFQQRVRLARLGLINEMNFYQNLGMQEQAAQALQQLGDPQGLGSEVINTLVNEAIYRQAAPSLGVSVSDDEVQQAIEEEFDYHRIPPTPAPTRTPAPTPTASATVTVTLQPTFTPAPTATPVTLEGFQQMFQQALGDLGQLGFSEADYRSFRKNQLIAGKVQTAVVRDVITTTDQVQFQYILASAQADIDAVQTAIAADGFDEVYGQVLSSTFVITAASAGDVPFVSKADLSEATQFGPRFADAVFTAPISSTFGVITDTSGSLYFLGRVLDRAVRDLDSAAYERAQSRAFQDWLAQKRTELTVEVLTWDDRVPTDPSPQAAP